MSYIELLQECCGALQAGENYSQQSHIGELRDEREARKNQSRTASINRSLKTVVAEINTAHQAQKSEVYSLNVVPEVAEMLREAGYKVQPSSAVRSGDLDSTHISW